MSAQVQVILIAAGCTSAVGMLGIVVLRLLRRAPLRLSLQAGSAVAVLAIVAGTLGTAETMFISAHDLGVVVMVCVVAGVAAFGFCWLLGRQVAASSVALREAARSLGHEAGEFRPPGGPMAAELAALSEELAATARKLEESRQRERRLEQSRRQLVAWVSHDLRTPLARLGAMAESLSDGMTAEPGRYHRQIRAEVTRLTGMVDDLFELARIQSGTLRLSPGKIVLRDLISDAVASTEALAHARGVQLATEADGPLVIEADPRELSRVLANLLSNAVQHTPAGGMVHIEARPEHDGALLAVTDACGGIPDTDITRVFDTGWRGTLARTPDDGGGAGLGLAIVRGIIEAHHGQVRVVNTSRGCRFEVRLPPRAVLPAGIDCAVGTH
ncbi:MAG TPA: HAMP domain-containing sensor histidine kinase [Streptosporangiaceae bacterium]